MPQARSSGSPATSSRGSSGKSTAGRSPSKRTSGSSSKATSPSRAKAASTKAASTKAASTKSASTKSASSDATAQAKAVASAAEQRLEQVAQRLRKLNERIIDAGRDAGETTLSSYEKALKAIATTIERGPGSSDVDWISNLATTQAKFIRDVTTAWTKAAREMLPK